MPLPCNDVAGSDATTNGHKRMHHHLHTLAGTNGMCSVRKIDATAQISKTTKRMKLHNFRNAPALACSAPSHNACNTISRFECHARTVGMLWAAASRKHIFCSSNPRNTFFFLTFERGDSGAPFQLSIQELCPRILLLYIAHCLSQYLGICWTKCSILVRFRETSKLQYFFL